MTPIAQMPSKLIFDKNDDKRSANSNLLCHTMLNSLKPRGKFLLNYNALLYDEPLIDMYP